MSSLGMVSAPTDAEMESPHEIRQLQNKASSPMFKFPNVQVQVHSPGPGPAKVTNPLNLTLPQHNIEFRFSSIETLVDGCAKKGSTCTLSTSPPRRIILSRPSSRQMAGKITPEIEPDFTTTTLSTTVVGKTMLKTPPLICEQGPSAPTSPTSPSPGRTKRPCPLSVDALQRFDLLSPNYVPSMDFGGSGGGHHQMTGSKGGPPPISPSYPTSDLGSSPRSSISATHYSQLGIGSANWTAFRDEYNKKNNGSDDTESDFGCTKDFLSPHQLFSPAPFSPYSDCGIDLNTSASVTPYSYRSPNLSPSPVRSNNLHFSFDQMVRSRSSMSNRGSDNHQKDFAKEAFLPQQRSLDQEARERSRSEGEMLLTSAKKRLKNGGGDDDEEMDTSIGHSTYSVPAATSAYQFVGGHKSQAISGAGHKRRLLQRCRKEQVLDEDEPGTPVAAQQNATATAGSNSNNRRPLSNQASGGAGNGSLSICQQDSLGKSASQQVSRQPTIEEPPPSPTLAELFHASDLDKDRRNQVEEWIRQQSAALEAFRQSLIPPQQESHHLQVPSALPAQLVPQNSLEQLAQLPLGLTLAGRTSPSSAGGPIRPATLWRRSRSESDVSASVNAAAAAAAAATNLQNPTVVALNDAIHVCEHCGQGFSMHDRLAKHIASRHRDRSASMNDENAKIHKCSLCPKSFGRSDMLTRHMRLHTGLKPYSCQICGQVFSRSDHLSTHQRTHTGEKPYRCPQCSYSASRRDMITRHMRTHLQPDGSPLPFTELQIPPINELSIATPNSQSPQPQHQPSQLSLTVRPHSPSPFNAATPPALFSNVPPSWPVPVPPPQQPSAPSATNSNPGTSLPVIPHSTVAAQQVERSLNNHSASPTPFSQNGLVTRTPSLTTLTTTAAVPSQSSPMAPFGGIFPLQPHSSMPNPTISTTNSSNSTEMMAAATKLLASAIAANGNSLLNQQMMLSTLSRSLDGQIPSTLRRSTPNLLSTGEHPSAFRPLKFGTGFLGTGLVEHHQPSQLNANTNFGIGNFPQLSTTNFAAAAAAVQLQQLLQQTTAAEQQRPSPTTAVSQQNLCSGSLQLTQPTATGLSLSSCLTAPALSQSNNQGLSFLFRQNSIGGFGFSEGINTGGGEANPNVLLTTTTSPSINK